jgi:malonate decarboxylase gamma subunit
VPMSYSMASFAKLGLLDELIKGVDADAPSDAQIEQVRDVLSASIRSAREDKPGLSHRLQSDTAKKTRAASVEVRRRLAEQWDAA